MPSATARPRPLCGSSGCDASRRHDASHTRCKQSFRPRWGAPLGADGYAVEGDGGEGDVAAAGAAGAAHFGGSGHVRLLLVFSQYQRRRVVAAIGGVATARGRANGEGGVEVPEQLAMSVREARDAVLSYRAAYLSAADSDFSIVRFWMALEAEVLHSMAQARHVAEPLLQTSGGGGGGGGGGATVLLWTELAALEARHGSVDKARGVYRRSLNLLNEPGEASVCHAAWLRFEEEHGTLGQLQDAEVRCAERMHMLLAKGQRTAQAAQVAAQEAQAAAEADEVARAAKKTAHNKERKQAYKAKRSAAEAGAAGGGGKGGGDGASNDDNTATGAATSASATCGVVHAADSTHRAKRQRMVLAQTSMESAASDTPAAPAATAAAAASATTAAASTSAAAPSAASTAGGPAGSGVIGGALKPPSAKPRSLMMAPRSTKIMVGRGAVKPGSARSGGRGRGGGAGVAGSAAPTLAAATSGGSETAAPADVNPGLSNEQLRNLMMSSSNSAKKDVGSE